MRNKYFLFFIAFVFLLGLYMGYQLSFRQQIDTSKLLNLVGLIYNLLAVVVLSEISVVRLGFCLLLNSLPKSIRIEFLGSPSCL